MSCVLTALRHAGSFTSSSSSFAVLNITHTNVVLPLGMNVSVLFSSR